MKIIHFRLTRENETTVLLEVFQRGRFQKVFRGNDKETKIAHAGLLEGIDAAGGNAISTSPEFQWQF